MKWFMKWLKKEEPKVLAYGLALLLIPSAITWAMGELSFHYVSANNAYWMVVWNISVYILMFFGILSLASTKEKTRPRLLAAGLGMTLLGIFSATNCAELLLKLTQLNSVDNERTVVFGSLLQNICLYLSAAVGGGILASSIFAEEKITQKTAPSTQAQAHSIQAPPTAAAQAQPSQQPPVPAAGQKQAPPVAATQVQPSQQPPAPAAGQEKEIEQGS